MLSLFKAEVSRDPETKDTSYGNILVIPVKIMLTDNSYIFANLSCWGDLGRENQGRIQRGDLLSVAAKLKRQKPYMSRDNQPRVSNDFTVSELEILSASPMAGTTGTQAYNQDSNGSRGQNSASWGSNGTSAQAFSQRGPAKPSESAYREWGSTSQHAGSPPPNPPQDSGNGGWGSGSQGSNGSPGDPIPF